ncbi:MAG: DUF6544 family protein [Mucilaginibacter sp.]
MKYLVFEIVIALIGLIITTLIITRIFLHRQFSTHVAQLFANAKSNNQKVFTYDQMANLPEPVKRYFKHVLTPNQPYVNYVRLKHDGQFKSGLKKEWAAIVGEEYFTIAQPGFIWKGKTSLFTAYDTYTAKKGKLTVLLFSLFKVAESHGEKYNQGELLRWLGESIWFPTNLLPGENLAWQPINNTSAKLVYQYDGMSLFFIVTFNNDHEIEQMQTERYMGDTGLQQWVIKCSNYQKRDGMLIPITAEVLWRLKDGDFSYARFNVTKLEYNKPIIF